MNEFLLPMDDPKVVKAIKKNLGKVEHFEKVLSPEQIHWLFEFCFLGCSRVKRNEAGTIIIGGELEECFKYLYPIIKECCPGAEDSPNVGGNFFVTPCPYGIHNDSMTKAELEKTYTWKSPSSPDRRFHIWKSLIFPIWMTPEDSDSQITFFKQRRISWAHAYNPKNIVKDIAGGYPILTDSQDIQFVDEAGRDIPKALNSASYDKEHYNKFLKHIPYERLEGLTPEKTVAWKPGDVLVFDSVQLHASNQGEACGRPWRIKGGLFMQFIKELD